MSNYTLLDDSMVHACLFTAMNGHYAVDPRSGSCLRISDELFQRAIMGTDPLARCSIAWGLSRETRCSSSGSQSTAPVAVVFVTHRCNLRCPYCYDRFSSKAGACDVDATCKSILSIARGGRVCVHFFGGEPMLELGLVRAIMERCRMLVRDGRLSDVTYSMTTNGTLLDRDMTDFLNQNQVSVRVSADGYTNGAQMWGAPLKAIDDERLAWITRLDSCVIRCTVLSGWTSGIVDMVSLWWERGVSRVAFAPAIDGPATFTSGVRDEYVALLCDLARAIEEGRFPASYVENFHRIESMIGHGPSDGPGERSRCDVHAIDVSGRILPCHRLVGRAATRHVGRFAGEDISMCTTCWARSLCQGLCRYELSTCDSQSLDNLCEVYMTEVKLGVWGAARRESHERLL